MSFDKLLLSMSGHVRLPSGGSGNRLFVETAGDVSW